MDRRAGHIQAAQRGAMPAQLRGWTKDELLVQFVGPAAEVAVDEAGILRLGLLGVANRPSDHRLGKTGGEPFQLSLDQAGNILLRAGDLLAARASRPCP